MVADESWRQRFFGRQLELAQLQRAYEAVKRGEGPRWVAVLGDRGMGKTRLVQELYACLTARKHDPDDYWPDASLVRSNSLRVAPMLDDPEVHAHFSGFALTQRRLPFLWWGFRLSEEGAVGLHQHRYALEPHLAVALLKRDKEARSDEVLKLLEDTEWWLLLKGLSVLSLGAVGIAHQAYGLVRRGRESLEEQRVLEQRQSLAVSDAHESGTRSLLEETLEQLGHVLGGEERGVPVVVFCDDAQFARAGQDVGARELLVQLWQRAQANGWPLLLVFTHWQDQWNTADEAEASFAGWLRHADASTQGRGDELPLGKESALGALVLAALPNLPSGQVQRFLDRADGNPRFLLELLQVVLDKRGRSAWWDGERLTELALEQLANKNTDLLQLTIKRLEDPERTPEEVQRVLALASLQGSEFSEELLCAHAGGADIRPLLQQAQEAHRMVASVGPGVRAFAQGACREAAGRLVKENAFGRREDLQERLLSSALSTVDEGANWDGLSGREQDVARGVLVDLAEHHEDEGARHRAGQALLDLVRGAVGEHNHRDYARGAQLAQRFLEGTDQRWSVVDFELWKLDPVREALQVLHGSHEGEAFTLQMLNVARELHAQLGTPQSLRDVSVSLNKVGAVAQARSAWDEAEQLFREGLQLRRELHAQLGTPQTVRDLAISLARVSSLDGLPREQRFALMRESASLFEALAQALRTPSSQQEFDWARERLAELEQTEP